MSSEVEEAKDAGGEDFLSGDNEPISNSSDLEQEKQRIAQEFHANGNIGTYQFFINSLDSMNLGAAQRSGSAPKPSNQTYQLYTRSGCSDFVERYKNSEHLAVAIVLSVIELVRLSDLSELKALLVEELPTAELEGEDGTPAVRDPYISMNTFLTAIGGEWFMNQDGQQCVGLGEHSRQALQMIWEQFPALRDPICRWLVRLCQVYKFRTAFDANQVVCAFVRVISLDFEDARKRIFTRLYSYGDSTGLLGNIMYKLYEDSSLQQEAEHMLLWWLSSESNWLWRPACLACSRLMPQLDHERFDPPLEKVMNRRLNRLTKGDAAFIAVLLEQSEYFRTLLTRLLGRAIQRESRRAGRLQTAQAYLYLLRNSYYLVNVGSPVLPLAACDSRQQQQFLAPVLRVVMFQSALRKQLYAILRAYMKELSYYQHTQQLVDHLCAYYYNMAQSAPDYWLDILQFLDNCQEKLSKQICGRLRSLYRPVQQLPSAFCGDQ